MLSYFEYVRNGNVFNLKHYQDSPFFIEWGEVNTYNRTSTNQSGEQRLGKYQDRAMHEMLNSKGIKYTHYADIGKCGYSIGENKTPELWKAIQTGKPILAFDWQRFCREPYKLTRFANTLFLTYAPLSLSESQLIAYRKTESNRFNSAGKGGRPPSLDRQKILDWKMLGLSADGIATMTGYSKSRIAELLIS